jgi:hypothetical protein
VIASEKIKNKNFLPGFTFIEALTLLFIFSLISLSFFSVISLGTRYILVSKNRLGAVALANEKMEVVRNLAYDDIGTVGGVVSGNLPQTENITQNGKNYKVDILVKYEDDPFDGTLGGSPNDVAYKDYKTVKISVSWNNGGSDQGEVEVVSTFVPQGLEMATAGDGVLSINVFSDQSGVAGVSQASVHISNPDVGINTTIETDNSGNIMLVGAKESIQSYQLTVSKSGYETVVTMPPYPNSTFNPVDVHASVISGSLNIINIVQNKTGSIRISTVDPDDNSVANVDFKLTGGRKIGTDFLSPFDPLYDTDIAESTGASGQKTYSSLSPGQYAFFLDPIEDLYVLVGLNTTPNFSLASEQSLELVARVINKNTTAALIRVAKNSDGSILKGAEVKLSNSSGYEETATVGEDGMAFFPVNRENPFSAGTYDLSVKADGFKDVTNQQVIMEGALLQVETLMEEN